MEETIKSTMENSQIQELLIRLDERTKSMGDDIAQIKKDLNEKFVTIVEFRPVRLIVYGMAGAIMIKILMDILQLFSIK